MTIEEQAIIVFEAKSKHILSEPNKSGYFDGFETSHEQGQFYQKVAELIKGKVGKWADWTDYMPTAYGEEVDDEPIWNFECSVCHYHIFEEPTNYCPNCGARMNEKEQDHE